MGECVGVRRGYVGCVWREVVENGVGSRCAGCVESVGIAEVVMWESVGIVEVVMWESVGIVEVVMWECVGPAERACRPLLACLGEVITFTCAARPVQGLPACSARPVWPSV